MTQATAVEMEALKQAAREVAAKAYAPYSGFHVGAAALWADGAVTLGVNVENASYPLALCAERHAVAAGVVGGHAAHGPLRAIAVWAASEGRLRPCGACRQVLQEFCGHAPEALLVACVAGTDWETRTLAELLPEAFDGGAFG